MSRICIIALIGLPAAGKSTFCQQVLKITELPFNVAHFSFDSILPFNAESLSVFNYRKERNKILLLLQSLVDALKLKHSVSENEMLHKIQITHLNSQDYVILFDDNNYYTSMRYKIYQLCKSNHLCFGQIYLPIDVTQALRRNAERDPASQLPSYVVEQMAGRLELPNVQCNSWELQTLYLNLDGSSCCNAIFKDFILNCFEHPLEVAVITTEDKTTNATVSPLHHLDVQLRRRIKIILDAESSKEVKKQKAQLLNGQRKEILRTFNKPIGTESINLEKLNELCELLN